jgi:transcriptional regulator GlxA family with amidase domain
VCVGAFLIAEAGLLNGRTATTHWRFGQEMASRFPGVRVQHDPLWVKDGNIYTSAGISAGIDLALAWVEEDCGAGLAHEAARELVLFLRRPGGQPQLSTVPCLAGIGDDVHSRAPDLDYGASPDETLGG